MAIERIILSANDDPAYLQWWPTVSAAWQRLLGIVPELAHITDSPQESLSTWGSVHVVKRDHGMPSGNQAMVSRLMLAAKFSDEVCVLSDIDMLPVSAGPFLTLGEVAASAPDCIVCYGADAYEHVDLDANPKHGSFPICYLAARGRVFGEFWDKVTSGETRPLADVGGDPWRSVPFCDETMLRYLGIAERIIGIRRGWPRGAAIGRAGRDTIDVHLPRAIL